MSEEMLRPAKNTTEGRELGSWGQGVEGERGGGCPRP